MHKMTYSREVVNHKADSKKASHRPQRGPAARASKPARWNRITQFLLLIVHIIGNDLYSTHGH